MSEENGGPGNPDLNEEPLDFRELNIDWVLADLAEMQNSAEDDGLPLWVTLMVGGHIVSGKLLNGKSYFEQYGQFWADMSPDDLKEKVREHYSEAASLYGPSGTGGYPSTYIHLAEAQIFSHAGRPIPGNQGINWRGKLSSVDAFWLGQLRATED